MQDYRDDPTTGFFELANAPCIRYRLRRRPRPTPSPPSDDEDATKSSPSTHQHASSASSGGHLPHSPGDGKGETPDCNVKDDSTTTQCPELVICQNSQAQTHTGGVVWETSFLLLEYLLHVCHSTTSDKHVSLDAAAARVVGPSLLEVGAGCGLLGMALAAQLPHLLQHVVLTETQEVYDTILHPNILRNQSVWNGTQSYYPSVSASPLDWTRYQEDAQRLVKFMDSSSSPNKPNHDKEEKDARVCTFDTIVGTDVVFSPPLVEPLLATFKFLAHDTTTVYLCLQPDRCPKSYQLLQSKCLDYGFVWKDLSINKKETEDHGEVETTRAETWPSPVFFQWVQLLESKIICLQRIRE